MKKERKLELLARPKRHAIHLTLEELTMLTEACASRGYVGLAEKLENIRNYIARRYYHQEKVREYAEEKAREQNR